MTTTSAPVSVSVTVNGTGAINVALASNGATALASSTYSSGYAPAGTINGDRKGLSWGAGGGWNDATSGTFPDWLEIDFNGAKTINEVDVFSVQDNYQAPSEPTPTMTFSLYGLTNFQVQYWDGAQWLTVPGGSISGNALVWRQITFAALTTSRVRIWITGALNTWSRIAPKSGPTGPWEPTYDLQSAVISTSTSQHPVVLHHQRNRPITEERVDGGENTSRGTSRGYCRRSARHDTSQAGLDQPGDSCQVTVNRQRDPSAPRTDPARPSGPEPFLCIQRARSLSRHSAPSTQRREMGIRRQSSDCASPCASSPAATDRQRRLTRNRLTFSRA